jgi:Tfp pilus assembly protein PilF
VLDYLRTAYFYSDFPDLQAEALYKTAKTFAEIGDTARLRKYSALLKERYPDSRYASLEIGL